MSVNITVKGKIARESEKRFLLKDADRIKKAQLDELKKVRLLQVREESKNLARKIRGDVAAEQERQLRKLEECKSKEFNAWREHVMALKNHDYRSAIFQVGAAHRAAQEENEKTAMKQKQKSGTYKDFQREMIARKSCNNVNNKKDISALCSRSDNYDAYSNNTHAKRKRNRCCCHEKCFCCCYIDSDISESTHSTSSLHLDDEMTCSDDETERYEKSKSIESKCTTADRKTSSCNTAKNKSVKETNTAKQKLQKTPAIILDVDVSSDESVEISTTKAPTEIKDKFADHNRQFTRVVRNSACAKKRECATKSRKSCSFKMVTDDDDEDEETVETENAKKGNKIYDKIDEADEDNDENCCILKIRTNKRHFTQVSDIVNKRSTKSSVDEPRTSNLQGVDNSKKSLTKSNLPKSLQSKQKPTMLGKKRISLIKSTKTSLNKSTTPTTTPIPPPPSPQQENSDQPGQTQQLEPSLPSGSIQSAVRQAPPSTSDVTSRTKSTQSSVGKSLKINIAAKTSISSSTFTMRDPNSGNTAAAGRVQFYDYNNKYTKEYKQSAKAVQASLPEQSQLNAGDHALIENQLQSIRQQEMNKLREISEQRGQKALEREQVRRDCAELTEKLDALSRQHPQLLPNDGNFIPSYRFAEAAIRREVKMNEAVEQILLKPAIITCPEVQLMSGNRQDPKYRSVSARPIPSTINVGDVRGQTSADATTSSDSCSILLGYVNNQTNQLRSDLTDTGSNPEKAAKLKNLLERIEKIRSKLLDELQAGSATVNGDNVQLVIDSIRRERDNILIDNKNGSSETPLDTREYQLQQKEAILDQKLRELYELQKSSGMDIRKPGLKTKAQNFRVKQQRDKPLEIIIKVKGDREVVMDYKESKTPAGERVAPISNKGLTELAALKPVSENGTASKVTARQNSYDSNSTSYRSLPGALSNNIDNLVQQMEDNKKTLNDENPSSSSGTRTPPEILNPLIANYVNRLLGMTRKSVNELGVSSSEGGTPSSSIVNTKENVTPQIDESVTDMERVDRVQNFIAENRSFINELQDTLLTHNSLSPESSMRAFDEVWTKRLKNSQERKDPKKSKMQLQEHNDDISRRGAGYGKRGSTTSQVSQTSINVTKATAKIQNGEKTMTTQKSAQVLKGESNQTGPYKQRHLSFENNVIKRTYDVTEWSSHQKMLSNETTEASKSSSKTTSQSRLITAMDSYELAQQANEQIREDAHKNDKAQLACPDSTEQMERYAKLTENCTQRIAELTDLINKVREEKQRLLEVTLSSVSDTGRNSTEYLDLPVGAKSKAQSSTTSDQSSASAATNQTHSQPTDVPTPTTSEPLPPENEPLQKNKPIGFSHDSGISMSRPITSLEQHQDMDPASVGITTQSATTAATAGTHRKAKPPPTIRRFSPHMIEEEFAHELSTIMEIETPVTTRVRASATTHSRQQPVAFPTFEQYAQEMKLDLSQIHPEDSLLLEQEFNDLMAAIKNSRGDTAINFREFPSISTYLQNVTAPQCSFGTNSPSAAQDLLQCLRIANISVRAFPTQREYMERLTANRTSNDDAEIVDSASLDNMTDTRALSQETDTESFNVEAELKKRNLLQSSFRRTKNESGDKNEYSVVIGSESGIDKLSTSDGFSQEMEREMQRLGMVMRQKGKQVAAAAFGSSSSSNTTSTSLKHNTHQPARHEHHDSAEGSSQPSKVTGESGRPLNLREFLIKELSKHGNNSGSSKSDDSSMQLNMIQSSVGSTAPSGTPRTNIGATTATLDRQKTSTPVITSRSSNSQSNSANSQLFSGESRLSSVHFHDNISVRYYSNNHMPQHPPHTDADNSS